jgi:hypothetical protein
VPILTAAVAFQAGLFRSMCDSAHFEMKYRHERLHRNSIRSIIPGVGNGQVCMSAPEFYGEIMMKIRSMSAALALGLGLVAAAEAQAWFAGVKDERPPPNGANGLSANGLVINGLVINGQARQGGVSEAAQLKAVVLKDGSRVLLK